MSIVYTEVYVYAEVSASASMQRSGYDRQGVIARKEKEEEGEEHTVERMRPSGTIARDATWHEESFLPRTLWNV